MIMNSILVIAITLFSTTNMVEAFLLPSRQLDQFQGYKDCFSFQLQQSNSDLDQPSSNLVLSETNQTIEWGVSYIGGDPCASKLNDDPFDTATTTTKPGMPDDMKARIAALAEQKKQQQQQQ